MIAVSPAEVPAGQGSGLHPDRCLLVVIDHRHPRRDRDPDLPQAAPEGRRCRHPVRSEGRSHRRGDLVHRQPDLHHCYRQPWARGLRLQGHDRQHHHGEQGQRQRLLHLRRQLRWQRQVVPLRLERRRSEVRHRYRTGLHGPLIGRTASRGGASPGAARHPRLLRPDTRPDHRSTRPGSSPISMMTMRPSTHQAKGNSMSDLIWEQSTGFRAPADSVAELQRDLAALSRVLLDIPLQTGARTLTIAVPELPTSPPGRAPSTSPGEAMRAYDLLDPYEAELLSIAEPFVLEETYDVAAPLALAETYQAFEAGRAGDRGSRGAGAPRPRGIVGGRAADARPAAHRGRAPDARAAARRGRAAGSGRPARRGRAAGSGRAGRAGQAGRDVA